MNRVLESPNPRFAEVIKPMDRDHARVVLRYLASEINRTYFWFYGGAQVALGGLLFLILWRQTPRDAISVALAGGMLTLAVILTLVVTPLTVSVGRSIDFLPSDPTPPAMARFWMLHGTFTSLDGLKLAAGLVLLVRWVWRR